MQHSTLKTLNRFIDFLYGINILEGLVFNALIILICFRSKLRKIPTFVYFAFGAISNTLSLFGQPLNYFLSGIVLDFNLRKKYLLWCKMVFYINFSTVQWNVWLLVCANF